MSSKKREYRIQESEYESLDPSPDRCMNIDAFMFFGQFAQFVRALAICCPMNERLT